MLEIGILSLDQIRMSLSSRSIIYVFFISVIFCCSAGLVYFTVYKKIVAKKFEIEEATEDIFANLDLHMLNGHFFVFQTKIYQFFNWYKVHLSWFTEINWMIIPKSSQNRRYLLLFLSIYKNCKFSCPLSTTYRTWTQHSTWKVFWRMLYFLFILKWDLLERIFFMVFVSSLFFAASLAWCLLLFMKRLRRRRVLRWKKSRRIFFLLFWFQRLFLSSFREKVNSQVSY